MYLSKLTLFGFRNLSKAKTFEFDKRYNLIVGKNAVGKTNLLDSLYLLSLGEGIREKKTMELVNYQANTAQISGWFLDSNQPIKLSINISPESSQKVPMAEKEEKNTAFAMQSKENFKKHFFINDLKKSAKEYRQRTFPVVLFQPQDLDLINGAPSKRREFLDLTIGQYSYSYRQARTNYDKGLYRRNKLLEQKEKYNSKEFSELLSFWDNFLRKNALEITAQRKELITFFNKHLELNGASFDLQYSPNEFGQDEKILADEMRQRRTLQGPQLDDFEVHMLSKESKPLSQYGSRSEQRLGVLWLKINELKLLEDRLGEAPLLLMDDIFSELDLENSQRILHVSQNYQTFITTAHLEVLPLINFPAKVINL